MEWEGKAGGGEGVEELKRSKLGKGQVAGKNTEGNGREFSES